MAPVRYCLIGLICATLFPESRALAGCFNFPDGERCVPDAIYVGCGRCGSTTLFSMLMMHPQFSRMRQENVEKELCFLSDSRWRPQNTHFDAKLTNMENAKLYARLFPSIDRSADPVQVRGDFSPGYISDPGAPNRALSVAPRSKLILMLREPGTQCYVSWHSSPPKTLKHLLSQWKQNICPPKGYDSRQRRFINLRYCDPSYSLDSVQPSQFFRGAQMAVNALRIRRGLFGHS